MSILKITALAGAAYLAAFLGYRYVTYEPGYYRVEQFIRDKKPEERFMQVLYARTRAALGKIDCVVLNCCLESKNDP